MKNSIDNKQHKKLSNKGISMILSVICFMVMAICVAIDFSISNKITWSLAYLISIPFVGAICIPIFTKSSRLAVWLAFISIFALPYLFFLETISSSSDWFAEIALPITLLSVITIWICFFALKRFKNIWFIAALLLFSLGAVVSPAVNLLVRFIATRQINISTMNIMSVVSCVVIAAILCIIGIIKRNKKVQK